MELLSEVSGITIGFAAAIISVISGIIWAYANLKSKVVGLESRLTSVGELAYMVRRDQNDIKKESIGLLDRMSRMEVKIDFIIEELKKK